MSAAGGRRLEQGALALLFVSAIGAAVFVGRLDSKVETLASRVGELDVAAIEEATGALRAIQEAGTGLPVGSIIDYVGPIASDADGEAGTVERLEAGKKVWVTGHEHWVVCNGATLAASDYDQRLEKSERNPAAGFQVPDLRGLFTKGVGYDELGVEGGSLEEELDIGHLHSISPCGGANDRRGLNANSWAEDYGARNCTERASLDTALFAGSVTVRHDPPHFGVFKIMRVK